ncbi:methylglyoxal synthase [Jannaschia sp. M317]|uniref:methylglyoxal synthase n=1 Tax=Jannaschia sp. M317 TaxID=2867011 RepID=UPI0021A43186|nr:methylglyoxal synthase [Jannaschia sp. M317]UWQ16195.1 methylglyoxal synthase [Jannaschia sp. M317]
MIALIAHDRKKPDLATWIAANEAALSDHRCVATKTTGGVLKERCPTLDLHLVESGPLGGDQQIGALIVEGRIDLLVFFTDPLSPHPHDVDVKALTRLAIVHDIPMACNAATADLIVASPGFAKLAHTN